MRAVNKLVFKGNKLASYKWYIEVLRNISFSYFYQKRIEHITSIDTTCIPWPKFYFFKLSRQEMQCFDSFVKGVQSDLLLELKKLFPLDSQKNMWSGGHDKLIPFTQ